jgi:hypothetical protein
MLRYLIAFVLMLVLTPAQDPAAATNSQVEVPTFANATCPIMGKPVSMQLFVDTELGRFYVCCKPCYKKVLADVRTAHKTAYPAVEKVQNTICPVSGAAIGADAVEVTLQGHRFSVCCEGCVADARRHSQITLLKLTRPGLTDVGNDTCPVAGTPVAPNAFVLVGDALVHLATPKGSSEVAKDPAALLAKAQAIANAQPRKPAHEHRKPEPEASK